MPSHFIFQAAATAWSLIVAVVVFLAYGYVEVFSKRGYVVVLAFGALLTWKCKYFILPLMFTASYFMTLIQHPSLAAIFLNNNQEIKLFSFVMLLLISLFLEQREEDDTVVEFRPCEEEIRQYLLERDPSLLPRVDSLLIKYKGKERQLLQKLKVKYGEATSVGTPIK